MSVEFRRMVWSTVLSFVLVVRSLTASVRYRRFLHTPPTRVGKFPIGRSPALSATPSQMNKLSKWASFGSLSCTNPSIWAQNILRINCSNLFAHVGACSLAFIISLMMSWTVRVVSRFRSRSSEIKVRYIQTFQPRHWSGVFFIYFHTPFSNTSTPSNCILYLLNEPRYTYFNPFSCAYIIALSIMFIPVSLFSEA